METTLVKKNTTGEIPEGWRINFAEECLEVIIDYRGKMPKKTFVGIPLITARIIKDGHINYSDCEYIAEKDYDDWMTRGISPGIQREGL